MRRRIFSLGFIGFLILLVPLLSIVVFFEREWERNGKKMKEEALRNEDPQSQSQWQEIQKTIAAQIQDSDPPFSIDEELKIIGGLDISFIPKTNEAAVCFVIMVFPSLQVIHEEVLMGTIHEPYIPGFLAFRELPLLSEIYVNTLKTLPESLHPQIIFIDGNGILHPHGAGLASHFGVTHSIPTIGVAKNFLAIPEEGPQLSIEHIKESAQRLLKKGDHFELIGGVSNKVYGMALCPSKKVSNPIFISVGHLVSLPFAVELTRKCCLYRVPEPIRQADQRGRAFLSSLDL